MSKKPLLLIAVFAVCLFCLPVKASASDPGYIIKSYDIHISVNANNTYDITENIGVHFTSPMQGISIKIPFAYKLTRDDGSTSNIRAVISNFTYTSPEGVRCEESSDGVNKIYKFGNSDTYAESNTNYSFSYNYDLGNDNNPKYDEVIYYLIGSGWDTAISNVTFQVDLPASFDKNKLFIGHGTNSSQYLDSSSVSYNIDGNSVTGKVDRILEPGENLTFWLKLPEGYFTNVHQTSSSYPSVTAIFIIIALIAIILWFLFGHDRKVRPELEYYPPEGYNSAETAYILNGKLTDSHVLSLILYLASKGYLKIAENTSQSMFSSKKTFVFSKLKEYDGTDLAESYIFDGLFGGRDVVSSVDLDYHFSGNILMAGGAIDSKENKNAFFEKSSIILKYLFLVLAVLIFAAANIVSAIDYSGTYSIALFTTIFPLAGIFACIAGIKSFKSSKTNGIFLIAFSAIWLTMALAAMLFPLIIAPMQYNPGLIPTYISGCICTAVLLILWSITFKRTSLGNELFAKALGFKEYLETGTAESDNQTSAENMQRDYALLPFVFAFDIYKKWANGFNSNTAVPNWYESIEGDFSTTNFCRTFDSAMSSVSSYNKNRRYSNGSNW